MKHKLAWAGLADDIYWKMIARFCIPSWEHLPGDKFVIHDSNSIRESHISVVPWKDAYNENAKFLKTTNKNKTINFWRKQQSQLWAVRNLKKYDFLILLDTDVEVIGWNQEEFDKVVEELLSSNCVWAVGESQLRKIDAGHILINMRHPDVDKLFSEYEDYWESGKIFDLAKTYDGHVIEELLKKYPHVKIKNRDYGSGLHVYGIGTVHWGSKLPKQLRSEWKGNGKDLVEKRLSEITIKNYKNDTRQTT